MVKLGFVDYSLSVMLLTNTINVLSINQVLAQFWIRCYVQQTLFCGRYLTPASI